MVVLTYDKSYDFVCCSQRSIPEDQRTKPHEQPDVLQTSLDRILYLYVPRPVLLQRV